MRIGMLLLASTLWAPVEAAAQAPACTQQLATLTVPRASYAVVVGGPFEGRLYIYVPTIRAGGAPGFAPFTVWVVEGVYGKPFVQATGTLDEAGFEKLRKSPNVRAVAVAVARGDGSDRGQFRMARVVYQAQVRSVDTKGGTVQVAICR